MSKYILPSKYPTLTEITLGSNKNVHAITKRDRFLDNGYCVQLIKEIPMKVQFQGDSLVLDQEALSVIEKCRKMVHTNHEYRDCEVYSLISEDERFMVMGYENEEEVAERTGTFLGGEGYYDLAKKIKEENLGKFYAVKIFDTDKEEVNY